MTNFGEISGSRGPDNPSALPGWAGRGRPGPVPQNSGLLEGTPFRRGYRSGQGSRWYSTW
jgi:hypothetical protein